MAMTVTETLRHALETCGQTRAQVSRDAEIDETVLCRFVAGKTLTGANLDTLCKHLSLSLQPTKGTGATKTTKTNARKSGTKG